VPTARPKLIFSWSSLITGVIAESRARAFHEKDYSTGSPTTPREREKRARAQALIAEENKEMTNARRQRMTTNGLVARVNSWREIRYRRIYATSAPDRRANTSVFRSHGGVIAGLPQL